MIERRRSPRSKTFKGAKVVCHGQAVVGCVVRDLSVEGAGLQLPSTADLPAEFDLRFDTGRKLRNCHIVWRTQSNAGVTFTP